MKPFHRRPWLFSAFALAAAAAAGTVPAHAARVGSFLYFHFDPQVIANDAKSATRLEVFTDRTNIRRVEFEVMAPKRQWLRLYDDGTHGDRRAGDGVFTRANLTSDSLGLTRYPLRFGGTHLAYGFTTRITKAGGVTETSNEVTIGIVDRRQRFPVRSLAEGIAASSHAVFLVDPSGELLDAAIPLGRVRCGTTAFGVFEKLYSVFPDAFDFVAIMPAAQIFDPSRGYAENVPYEVNVRNADQNIGLGTVDRGAEFHSPARLKSMIYHSFGYGAILDHEVGHRWVLGFGRSLGLSDGVHWDANTDIGGQMASFVFLPGGRTGRLTDNADGTWRVERDPANREPYSKLDLYLMGLLPPAAVPPLHKLTNPDFADPDRVTAQSVETFTIDELMAAEGGPRSPAAGSAPKTFRLALVAVKNKAFTPAEEAWFSLVARYFASTAQGDLSLTTFFTATGGRARLNAKLPAPLP
jgi:hypothetical protein